MNEKKLYFSQLYDYYGALLSDKQKYAIEMYYNDDLSLSEIAESIGITRQGVRDQLKHAEDFLNECEKKLGFADKLRRALILTEEIQALSKDKKDAEMQEIFLKSASVIELLS